MLEYDHRATIRLRIGRVLFPVRLPSLQPCRESIHLGHGPFGHGGRCLGATDAARLPDPGHQAALPLPLRTSRALSCSGTHREPQRRFFVCPAVEHIVNDPIKSDCLSLGQAMADEQRSLRVAIPLFDHMTALDAIGPYEVLSIVPGVSVVFVSDKPGLVVAGETSKLRLEATASYEDVPHPDLILVPGGPPNKIPLHHKPLLDWIRKAHETTLFTTSVCTGSLLLGSAGVLNGVEAATHWGAYKILEEFGAKPCKKRYIQQGKIITAAGVSAGIDMALKLAAILKDDDTAKAVQLILEYDPEPPFDCGSVEKAGPEIMAKAGQLID